MVLATAFLVGWWRWSTRRYQLKHGKLRPNLTEDEFTKYFGDQAVDPDVAISVRDIVSVSLEEELNLHPTDSLKNFLKMEPDEIEETVEMIFDTLSIDMPDPKNPLMIPELKNVADLVLFIDCCYKDRGENENEETNPA